MSLFDEKDVKAFRQDRLGLLVRNLFPGAEFTDSFVLDKIKAAEAETSRKLAVKLEPTKVFPGEPTDEQVTALNGMPYIVEPGYDFDPELFANERWGRLDTRQRPIISVESIKFAYPAPGNTVFDVPQEWMRLDKKYGVIQLVPAVNFNAAPLGAFVMSVLGGGSTVPFMIRMEYTCGLADPLVAWPDLVDVILKTATLKIVQDPQLPQSASTNADGLSQSRGLEIEKLEDTIDRLLFGGKGSNGGLRTAIHGVQMDFLGR